MKHIGFSGAGFAISGIAGAGYELLNSGYNPDIVSGISSGALLTFVICASKNPLFDIKNNAVGFKSSQVFSNPPMTKKGKITLRSIWNAITKNYLAEEDKLDDFLRTIISKEDWSDYLKNDDAPIGIIMSVDAISGARVISNLKELSYEEAILHVVASTSIPVFVNPVEFGDMLLVDGGVRNHIMSEWVFDNYDVKDSYSIFSRPENFDKPSSKKDLKTTYGVLERTVEIMQFEISKTDQELAELKAYVKGIQYRCIYIKNILDNTYEENAEKQIQLFQNGIDNAKKVIK